MDDVARLPITDRTDLFVATAGRRALTTAIIEKDFWVCWTPPIIDYRCGAAPAHPFASGGRSRSRRSSGKGGHPQSIAACSS